MYFAKSKYFNPGFGGLFIPAKSGHAHGFFRKSKIYFYNKNTTYIGEPPGILQEVRRYKKKEGETEKGREGDEKGVRVRVRVPNNTNLIFVLFGTLTLALFLYPEQTKVATRQKTL